MCYKVSQISFCPLRQPKPKSIQRYCFVLTGYSSTFIPSLVMIPLRFRKLFSLRQMGYSRPLTTKGGRTPILSSSLPIDNLIIVPLKSRPPVIWAEAGRYKLSCAYFPFLYLKILCHRGVKCLFYKSQPI